MCRSIWSQGWLNLSKLPTQEKTICKETRTKKGIRKKNVIFSFYDRNSNNQVNCYFQNVFFLNCVKCRDPETGQFKKVCETNIFTHLRKKHNLAPGGKRTAPTNPKYENFHLEVSPFNIRELLTRAVSQEFLRYCRQWLHLGVRFSFDFALSGVHNEHEVLLKIEDGKFFWNNFLWISLKYFELLPIFLVWKVM